MKFDVSRRFQTKASEDEIAKFLEDSFRKDSNAVNYNSGILTVELINPTFAQSTEKIRQLLKSNQKTTTRFWSRMLNTSLLFGFGYF